MTDARLQHAGYQRRHPTDEMLAAYLTTGLADHERHGIEQHIMTCDRCIQTLLAARHRLAAEDEVAVPVPAAVQERARAVVVLPPSRVPRPVSWTQVWWATISDRLSGVFRLPLWVPAAVAVGAVLIVATQQVGWSPGPSREMSRGVEMRQRARVTASVATVRAQPSTRADTVAVLSRGAALDISATERDWCRVVLPDGRSGWVERSAFE